MYIIGRLILAMGLAVTVACTSLSTSSAGLGLSTTSAPGSALADGNSAIVVTVAVATSFGTTSGLPVTFTVANSAVKAISIDAATNANGAASARFVSTQPGAFTVEIAVSAGAGFELQSQQTITFVAQADEQALAEPTLRVAVLPSVAPADGHSSVQVLATGQGADGTPLAGLAIHVETRGSAEANDRFVARDGLLDANGTFQTSLTSTAAGSRSLYASVGNIVAVTGVQFVAGAPSAAQSSLAIGSRQASADGRDALLATVTVLDALGNPVPGQNVAVTTDTNTSSLQPPTGVTDSAGHFVTRVTSTATGSVNVVASLGTITLSGTAAFAVGQANLSLSTLEVPGGPIVGDGNHVAILRLSLRDSQGRALGAAPVTFSTNGDPNAITLDANAAVTDDAGTWSARVSSRQIGPLVVTTSGAGLTLSGTLLFVAGPISPAQSSFVITGGPLVADGASTASVQVTLGDALGHPVEFAPVILSAALPGLSFSPSSGLTDAAGRFAATVSSRRSGVASLTASVPGSALSASLSLLPGAPSAAASTLTASPASVLANGNDSSLVSVVVRDALGNPEPNLVVAFDTDKTHTTLVPPSGLTDAQGVFRAQLRSTESGAVSVGLILGGTRLVAPVTFVPAAPDSAASSLVLSPNAQVVADQTQVVAATLLLRDAYGNPASAQIVHWSSSQASDVLLPATGVTDANGQASTSWRGSVTGLHQLSVQSGSAALQKSLSFVAGPPSSLSRLTVLPSTTVVADGIGQASIAVQASDALGNAVAGANVRVSSSNGNDSLVPVAGTTDAYGSFLASWTSTRAERKTVTATVGDVGAVMLSAAETFVPGPVDASHSTLRVSPSSLTASAAASVVELVARDAYNNVLPGAAASFAASSNTLVLLPNAGLTGDDGRLLATVSSTRAGSARLVASVAGTSLSANVTVAPGPLSTTLSSLRVQPSLVTADGVQAANVTLCVLDATQNPLANQNVSFAATPALAISFWPAVGVTDANGCLQTSATGSQAGTTSIVATSGANSFHVPLTLVAGPPSASTSSWSAAPNQVTADGISIIRAQLTLRDATNNAIANRAVSIDSGSNAVSLVLPNGSVTDGDGRLQAQLSSSLAQQTNVMANVGGNVLLATPIAFVAGSASATHSTLSASPSAGLVANGNSQTTLSLTIKDALDNPVANRLAPLSCSSSACLFGQANVLLDGNGQATTTLSTTSAGVLLVTAVIDATSLSVPVAFVAGAADANQSYFGASPTSVVDDGNSRATLFLQAADAFGNPVGGAPVGLSASGANVTLAPPSGVTADDGSFVASISARVAEAKTVTLTIGSTSLATDVNFVVGLPDTQTIVLSATPNAIVANGVDASALQLQVKDASGQAIAGAPVHVSLAGASAAIGATDGTTDANGLWSTSLTGSALGTARVTARVAGVDALALVTLVAGQPNWSLSTLSAAPPVALADGNASIGLTLRLYDDQGHPIAGRSGNWSSLRGSGTFLEAVSTTTSAGIISNSLRATASGNDVVSFATAGGNLSVPIAFVAGSARNSTSSVVAMPSSVVANGNDVANVLVSLRDAYGNPVIGAACTLSSASGNVVFGGPGGANVLLATSDANGMLSSVASSTQARVEQVFASAAGVFLVAPLSFVAGPPVLANSSLTALPMVPIADGSAQAQLLLQLVDAFGNPVASDTVTASVPSGTATPLPTIANTDGNGRLLFQVTSQVAGIQTLVVQEARASLSLSANARFAPGAPSLANSSWLADANAVTVDDTQAATLTLLVLDAFGNAVSSVPVVVSIGGAGGLSDPVSGVSDQSGRFVSRVSATFAETKSITASFAGGQRSSSVTFLPGPANANTSGLSASPLMPVADNVSPVQVIASVRDTYGNAVPASSVSFTSSDANDWFSATSASSDAAGVAVVTLRSGRAGSHTLMARIGGGNVLLPLSFSAGAVSSALSTLVVSPNVVVADGSAQGLVTIYVLDALRNPAAGQAVSLFVSGSNNALSRSIGLSDANGLFTAALSSAVAEPKALTASVGGVSWSGAASFVSGPPAYATSSLTASPLSVTANGTSVSTLVGTFRDAFGNPCGNVPTTFSSTGSSNSFGQAVGLTDSTGSVVTTLSSPVAQSKAVQVTSGVISRSINLLFLPGAPDSSSSSLLVTPSAQVADGTSGLSLVVTARDARGNAIGGQAVSLGASQSATRFAPSSGVTNAAGVFSATAVSTQSGSVQLSANVGSTSLTQSANFLAGAADGNTSSVTVSPSQLVANGNAVATIQVVAADAFANRVANQNVNVSVSGGNNVLGQAVGTTDATGTFVTTLRSATAQGKVVTATLGAVSVSTPVTFVTGGASSQTSSLSTQSAGATVADGVQAVSVLLAARDAQGNPIANQSAIFSVSGSYNTLSATSVTTDSNGLASVTLSSRRAETKVVQATISGASLSTQTTFVAGAIAPSHSALSITPNVLIADGNSLGAAWLKLADAFDNPVGNVTVSLSASGGNYTLQPSLVVTDAMGAAGASFSARRAEAKTLTATWSTGALVATAQFVPGSVSNVASSLQVSPNQVIADGVSQAILSVNLADVLGNPVAFERVSFAASGLSDASVFSSPNTVTDAAGKANVTVGSTLVGARTVTAQAQGTSLSGNLVFLPGPPSTLTSTLVANPNAVTADGASGTTLLLVVRDAFNNPVPNAAVVLSASSGSNTFGQGSGSTSSVGSFVTSLRSVSSGTRTLTASVGGTAISTVVSFVAGAPSAVASSWTASPTQVVADGQPSISLSLALRDAQNNSIANAPVLIALSGASNALAQASGVTDGNGLFATQLGSTRAQSEVATVTSGALSLTAPCTFVAGAPTTQSVVLTASPNRIVADGNSKSVLTLRVADAQSNPIPNSNVVLSSTGTPVSLSPQAGVTDANGLLTTQLWGSQAGAALVAANVGAISVSTSVSLVPGNAVAARSTLALTPNVVTADGNSAVAISLTVRDAQNNVVPSQGVVFSSSGTANVLATQATTTDGAGSALSTLRSGVAETKVLTASFAGQSLTGNVAFVPGAASNTTSTLVASPNIVVADGNSFTTLTLVARDALNNRAMSRAVTFSSTGSNNQLSALNATTDGSGTATITARSTLAESKSFIATIDGTSFATSVQFIAGAPNQMRTVLVASPNQGMADGSSPVLLTLSAQDAFGNAIGNQAVAWSSTGSLNVLSSTGSLTDGSGFSSILLRSRRAEPKTIGALIGSLNTQLVVPFVAGPIDANFSTLSLTPSSVVADTVASIAVSVAAADRYGNPAGNQPLSIAVSGTNNVLDANQGVTDASGAFVTALRSSTAQSKAVVATIAGVTLTNSATFVAGSPNAARSVWVASPNTNVIADSIAGATLSASLADAFGNPLYGQIVSLSASGSGGTLQPSSGATGPGGNFATTLTSTKAETKTVTLSAGAMSLPATVAFVSGPAATATSVLVANPTSGIVADGNAITTLSAQVADAYGNPVGNQLVSVTATGSSNVFSAGSGTTNAAGLWTTTLRSSRAQPKTISLLAGSATASVAVSFVPGSPNSSMTTLVASPGTGTVANNVAPVSLVATVVDAFGNPISNQAVSLASSGSNHTFAASSGNTDTLGSFATTLRSSRAESKTITLTAGAASATATTTFVAGNANAAMSTLVASPNASLVADGVSSSAVTLVLRDAYGNAVQGQNVTLSSSNSGDVLSSKQGTTDGNGTFVSSLSSTYAGAKTLTLSAGATTLNTTAGFVAGPPSSGQTTLVAVPSSNILANNSNQATLTATVLDAQGNPVSSQNVTLSSSNANDLFGATSGTTDTSGRFVTSLRSKKAQPKVVTLTAGPASATTGVTFVVGSPNVSLSTLTIVPSGALTADGNTPTQVSLSLVDDYQNPIAGRAVVFSSSNANDIFASENGITSAAGLLSTSLTSTRAETKTITATIGAYTLSSNVSFVAGPLNPGRSTFVASPTANIVANNTASSLLSVVLRDANFNGVANQNVSVSSSVVSDTFGAASGVSDANGQFATNLRATKSGSRTISLVAGAYSSSLVVSFVSGPAANSNSVLSASPNAGIVADASSLSTLTVLLADAFGNRVSGQSVSLTPSNANDVLSQPSGSTDANGLFVSTLKSSKAEAKSIGVSAGPVSGNISVSFVAGAPNQVNSSLLASPTSNIVADNNSTSSLSVHLGDAFANPVSNFNVSLAATGTNNTFASPTGITDASGGFVTTLKSSTAQSKVVTLTAGSYSPNTVITFVAGTPNATSSTLALAPSGNIVADGNYSTAVNLRVYDAYANAIGGQNVTFACSPNCAVSPGTALTDASGLATTALAGTAAGSGNVTATFGAFSKSIQATFVSATTPASLTLTPNSVVAGGNTIVSVKLVTSDSNGTLLSNQAYRFLSSVPGVSFAKTRGASDANGIATTTLSSLYAGIQPVRAVFGSNTINANLIVSTKTPTCPSSFPLVDGQPWITNTTWSARRLVLTDLNGDGHPDVAFTSDAGDAFFEVLLNDGNGFFRNFVKVPASGYQYGIAAADVTGDGYQDIITTSNNQGYVSIFAGAGNGNFSLLKNVNVGSGPWEVVATDFDGDSLPDLAVTNAGSSNVSLLWNSGNGNFSLTTLVTDATPHGIAFGLLNNDANRDLVVACSSTSGSGVNVFLNQGGRSFSTKASYLPGVAANSVAVADLNNDGYGDLAVSAVQSNGLLIYTCNSAGACALNGNYRTADQQPSGIALFDVNFDGNIDVLQAQPGASRSQLFMNQGSAVLQSPNSLAGSGIVRDTGVFVPGNSNVPVMVSVSSSGSVVSFFNDVANLGPRRNAVYSGGINYPRDFVIGDFNGDGAVDVFLANFYSPCPVYLGLSAGNVAFGATPNSNLNLSNNGFAARSADVNADGNLDIIVGLGSGFDVFLNAGNASFSSRKTTTTTNAVPDFQVVDWNNDGYPDVLGIQSTGVSVYSGIGNGNFSYTASADTTSAPATLGFADFDQDGAVDLAVSGAQNGNVFVFYGRGDGTIARTYVYTAPSGSYALVPIDLNGDGFSDLSVFMTNASAVTLINQGNGSFASQQTLVIGSVVRSIDIGDFTGDGRPDIMGVANGDFSVMVLANQGDGTLAAPVRFSGPCGDLTRLHTYITPSTGKPVMFAAGDTDQAVVYMQSSSCQ